MTFVDHVKMHPIHAGTLLVSMTCTICVLLRNVSSKNSLQRQEIHRTNMYSYQKKLITTMLKKHSNTFFCAVTMPLVIHLVPNQVVLKSSGVAEPLTQGGGVGRDNKCAWGDFYCIKYKMIYSRYKYTYVYNIYNYIHICISIYTIHIFFFAK